MTSKVDVGEIMEKNPRLYGLSHTNRSPEEFWTKNCFNSSFPVSLACFMRDSGYPANYITSRNGYTSVGEIKIDDVFMPNGGNWNELYFAFESVYEPYYQYVVDWKKLDGIDLVIKNTKGNFITPLEIKLTVLPDNSTIHEPERYWGSEIVIRSATTSYCVLGMYDACKEHKEEIKNIFKDCNRIEKWDSSVEVLANLDMFVSMIKEFEKRFIEYQKPLLMQPIWKTRGQSSILEDDAFDIFVWSDHAFTTLCMDSLEHKSKNNKVSRPERAIIRMARGLYELSMTGEMDLDKIYRKMAFNNQTDKEFSVNGKRTNKYMSCPRLKNPVIKKGQLFDIILDGGEELLMPERRFDQTIYFNMAKQNRN